MNLHHLHRSIADMHASVARGEDDALARDEADARFREAYRRVWKERARAPIPQPLEEELRQALIALAGADDWTRARRHLEQALELSDR